MYGSCCESPLTGRTVSLRSQQQESPKTKNKKKAWRISQKRKISPKRKFSAGRPCGHPAKNFGQDLQVLEKQAFWHGHAERTSTKKLRSAKLRADFSFPNLRQEKGTQNLNFWVRYFPVGYRGLPRDGMGAKKFGMSLETREIKLFGRDIPGFCRDIPAVPEKFEKKKLCSISVP